LKHLLTFKQTKRDRVRVRFRVRLRVRVRVRVRVRLKVRVRVKLTNLHYISRAQCGTPNKKIHP
jgi:hypothetical protein